MSNIIIPGDVGTVLEGGQVQTLGAQTLSDEDAQLLRAYKKFLQRQELREALYCQRCWGHNLADGCEAHVTADDILIKCRCTLRHHRGSSY